MLKIKETIVLDRASKVIITPGCITGVISGLAEFRFNKANGIDSFKKYQLLALNDNLQTSDESRRVLSALKKATEDVNGVLEAVRKNPQTHIPRDIFEVLKRRRLRANNVKNAYAHSRHSS